MVAVATRVPQAVAGLTTLTPTAQAAALGYPATLVGFTPDQRGYWFEPGLPWFTAEMFQNHPLDNREGTPDYFKGWSTIPCIGDVECDHMAPRFPRGCAINTMPVHTKDMLVVGKVYTYRYTNSATGLEEWNIGRLVKIGGNYLEVASDNPSPDEADRTIWLLEEEEHKATWAVREVTHYASYPSEEGQGRPALLLAEQRSVATPMPTAA
ncbi:hypothetical protein GCM10023172_27550 [Hymenobacter ginsengisoli]|uniref:Lipocalin-like domain-containing protein n=1 Tax=Hymenobacter ginsengisoli TaxID=1051626 RepID=A0ABP8QLR4_9BACT|nr:MULTISPECIES: hypothetical protein [unclassified Hymenobacter]MBO2029990.1 hypothetical protein [Hymenobacter sp. BT559]